MELFWSLRVYIYERKNYEKIFGNFTLNGGEISLGKRDDEFS